MLLLMEMRSVVTTHDCLVDRDSLRGVHDFTVFLLLLLLFKYFLGYVMHRSVCRSVVMNPTCSSCRTDCGVEEDVMSNILFFFA
jgi:hypothetical protein